MTRERDLRGGPGQAGRSPLGAAIRNAGLSLARRARLRPQLPLAPRPEWTYRRIPGPVARGLLAACIAAVGLLIGHVDGWGLLGRIDLRVIGATYLVGLPVALLVAFFLVAPMLRRLARARPLTLRRVAGMGAACYGGLVFCWMLLIPVGPPGEVLDRLLPSGPRDGTAAVWLVGAYRHGLTPGAFALYGAVAAVLGWLAAFGPRRTADLRPLTRPPAS